MINSKMSQRHLFSMMKRLPPIVIAPKKLIFFTIFFLVFCLSGVITMLDIVPYRMGLVSGLVLFLIPLYGLKIDRVFVAYTALTIVVGFSALYNQLSLFDFILFMRILIFSYLMYYLVQSCINRQNIVQVMRLCVVVALIQLPIVILQIISYDYLPVRLLHRIFRPDFDFGTFNFKGDSAMAFFLLLMIIFLLFDTERHYIIPYRWIIVFWLTLTVLIANSEAAKFILICIWIIFGIRYFSLKTIIYLVIMVGCVVGVLAFFGVFNEIIDTSVLRLERNLSVEQFRQERFLRGRYGGRGAAIAYYVNQGISWFGDGPSKYYDVFAQTRIRRDAGHIFTFYSEVGLLGWLLSVFIFFLIVFPGQGWYIRASSVCVLSFLSVQMLSFTTQIMNSVDIFLIYCLVAKSYLIPLSNDN